MVCVYTMLCCLLRLAQEKGKRTVNESMSAKIDNENALNDCEAFAR